MPEIRKVDIAIVGGGIAGPALACALADTGLRILLVERSAEPLDTARGDHLQPHTCEWLQEWGALDAFWARGAERRLGSRYLTPAGENVLHAAVDQLEIPHPYYIYLNHELISAALLEIAAHNPGFEIMRPATARLIARTDRFALEVEGDGSSCRVDARLIVAADGRNSRLRRSAGIEAETYAYRNPMLTFFAERTISDPRNEVRAYFSPVGVVSVIPRTGGGWKIGVPMPPEELPAFKRASSEELGERFAHWVPELAGVRPQICGVYPVAMINAAAWSEQNLVLAGDACHALHPGRSQGMNIALRAVHSLAGRLRRGALDSAGALREALQSFEAELKPGLEERLAANHTRGLEMDHLDPADLQRMQAGLAAVAADPARRAAYCLTAAGY